MSKGNERVGVSFNPSGDLNVANLKSRVALLIDDLEELVQERGEAGRCAAIAQTEFESAAMWAVKALTKPRSK